MDWTAVHTHGHEIKSLRPFNSPVTNATWGSSVVCMCVPLKGAVNQGNRENV